MKTLTLFFYFFMLVSIFTVGFILGMSITDEKEWLERATIYELAHNEFLIYKFNGYYKNYTFEDWYKEAWSRERDFEKEVDEFFEEMRRLK